MGTLSDIVNVDIALNSTSVSRGEFGVQLIASPLASFSERVRTYTGVQSFSGDNLPPTLQKALTTAFSQTPKPRQVKVGRLSVASVEIQPVDAIPNGVYGLTIGTTVISVTAVASPTTSTIATQLTAAINTAALGVTATAAAGVVSLVFSGDIVPLTKFVKVEFGAITPSSVAGSLVADLNAITQEDGGYYALEMTERTKQRILDAAAWTEANERLFVVSAADSDILNPSVENDLLSTLQSANYFRTAFLFDKKANEQFAEVAWASRCFSVQPGGDTWGNIRVAGVSANNLTPTEAITVMGNPSLGTVGKGGNTIDMYQRSSNLSLVRNGKVVANEWIDIIRFRDYLKDLIQTNLVQLIVSKAPNKIPYTDQGIQLIANNLRGSLRTGQQVGGIAADSVDSEGNQIKGFEITVPLAFEIDNITKATRVVKLEFRALISGAIQMGVITGSLTYSFD
jgi:hypothetical protein